MKRGLGEIALSAAILAGCMPELEQHDGEHILFEHSPSLEACAGTIDYLDKLIPFLSEQLGIPVPEQIRYSWLTRADRDRLLGPRLFNDVHGLAVAYHAMSWREAVIEHEIVHSLMGLDVTAPFFAEGLAAAYQALVSGSGFTGAGYTLPDPRPMMTLGRHDGLEFSLAGEFVYFLIARHGPGRFVELYASVHAPYTLAQIRAAFRATYGLELDDEVERFMSGARSCDEDFFEILATRCVAPVQPWQGEFWTFADVLACDGPGVVGGSTNGADVDEFRVATLEIPRTGLYEIRTVFDDELRMSMVACFGCPWQSLDVWLARGVYTERLAAGRYHVRVEGDADLGARFSMVVRPVDGGAPAAGD